MIRLRNHQVRALLEADWRGDGPIRLNESLSLPDLSGCLVLDHARLVMREMAADKGVKLTETGNFSRKFVERMVEEFRWPGFEPAEVWWLNKVLNEPDFIPLRFLRALIDVAGLGRKYKGCFRLTRLGRSLLAPAAAGELNAVLFDATWHRYNIAYLDGFPATDEFQPQIGLTLFMIGEFAQTPRSAKQLLTAGTLPIDPPESEYPSFPEAMFRARVLMYLQWFGLLEAMPMAANDEMIERYLYRKTPLFDRFLSFYVEAETS